MRIIVTKVPYEDLTCSGVAINYQNKCPENPEYFVPPKKAGYRHTLKIGVVCGYVGIGSAYEYYCPDCMEHLWIEMKSIFNHNLWTFK